MRADRVRAWLGHHSIELAWAAFVLANTWGILEARDWATVPFHFIWISLALLYGFRIWPLRVTLGILLAVVAVTSVGLALDVAHGYQMPDELTEIPLMSAVFLAMLWHVRRAERAKAELREVSRRNLELLERQQRFIQDASHVLRTPLTIARGHAELLARSSRDPGAVHDAGVIVEEIERLQRLSDRLLGLVTDGSGAPGGAHPVDVADLLRRFCHKWAASEAPIALGPCARATIEADPQGLLLALDELVDNSLHHAPGAPISVSVAARDGRVHILFTDLGPGLPEPADRLFERFARGDPGGRGQGLGLAVVKRLVEEQGGRVRAVPHHGPGAWFELSFPAAQERAPELGGAMSTGPSRST